LVAQLVALRFAWGSPPEEEKEKQRFTTRATRLKQKKEKGGTFDYVVSRVSAKLSS